MTDADGLPVRIGRRYSAVSNKPSFYPDVIVLAFSQTAHPGFDCVRIRIIAPDCPRHNGHNDIVLASSLHRRKSS